MLNQNLKKDVFQTFLKHGENFEAIGDYTFEMEEYNYKNENRKKLFITRLDIMIEDNAKMKYNKYSAESILKNGVHIFYTSKGIKHYITDKELPIKANRDWLHYPCKVEQHSFNNNHSFIKIIFNFMKDFTPIILEKNDVFGVELNDDFSGLENHTFHINGFHIKI